MLLAAPAGVDGQVPADTAVPTETIARLQLEDGTFTLTARGDGRVTVAVLKLAPLDVAAADFSMPTLRALVTAIRAGSAESPGAARSAVMFSSVDDRMAIGVDRRMPPMLIALRGRDRVPVVLRLDGVVTVDTVASTVERAIERARDLTRAHAPALVDATDLDFIRMARSRVAITTPQPASGSQAWSKADRGYFILMGALVGGVAASALAAKGDACWDRDRVPCPWQEGARGAVIAGTITMSSAASLLSMKSSQSNRCDHTARVGRSVAGALIGAIPGAILAMRGDRAGLAVMPVGQMAAILRLTNECANPGQGS